MVQHKRKIQPRNNMRLLVGQRIRRLPDGLCDCGVDRCEATSLGKPPKQPKHDSVSSETAPTLSGDWVRCEGCGQHIHSECAVRTPPATKMSQACRKCADTWDRLLLREHEPSPDAKKLCPNDRTAPTTSPAFGPVMKRKWVTDEDVLLHDAVAELGEQWLEVAEHVSGRNFKQCRDRWKIHLLRKRIANTLAAAGPSPTSIKANTLATAGTSPSRVEIIPSADQEAAPAAPSENSIQPCTKNTFCDRPDRHVGVCSFRLDANETDSTEATRILLRQNIVPDTVDLDTIAPLPTKRTRTGFVGVYPGRKGRFQAQVLHRAIGAFPATLFHTSLRAICLAQIPASNSNSNSFIVLPCPRLKSLPHPVPHSLPVPTLTHLGVRSPIPTLNIQACGGSCIQSLTL